MAGGLKLWLQEVEGFALSIYIVRENKGADQVRGNRTADLHLLFSHIEKKSCFLMTRFRYRLLFMPFPLTDIADGCIPQCWILWGNIGNNDKLHGVLLYFTADQIKLGCGCCFPSIFNEAYGVDTCLRHHKKVIL